MAKAVKFGEFFRALLKNTNSPLVREVRGMGFMNGVELTVKSAPIVRQLQDMGLLALPAGPFVVRFLSPFVAEKEHFERAADMFDEVLKRNEHGYGK